MKQKMTVVDLKASIDAIRRDCLGLHLNKVYNCEEANKYVFKFSQRHVSDEGISKDKYSTSDPVATHELEHIKATVLGQSIDLSLLPTDPLGHPCLKCTTSMQQFLFVELGAHVNTSSLMYKVASMPSYNTMKLRSYIQGKRLDDVRHCYNDLIVALCFSRINSNSAKTEPKDPSKDFVYNQEETIDTSSRIASEWDCDEKDEINNILSEGGVFEYILFIELFDKGNIVLVNYKNEVVLKQRKGKDVKEYSIVEPNIKKRVNEIEEIVRSNLNSKPSTCSKLLFLVTISAFAAIPELRDIRKSLAFTARYSQFNDIDRFGEMVNEILTESCVSTESPFIKTLDQIRNIIICRIEGLWEKTPGKTKWADFDQGSFIKEIKQVNNMGTHLAEHVLTSAIKSFPNTPITSADEAAACLLPFVMDVIALLNPVSSLHNIGGICVAAIPVRKGKTLPSDPIQDKELVDYYPDLPLERRKASDMSLTKFPSFTAAVDYFYRSVEVKKHLVRSEKGAELVQSTKERVGESHQKRLDQLNSDAEKLLRSGEAIISNAKEIDECISLIGAVIGLGYSHANVAEIWVKRKNEGHPIADRIVELHLDRSAIVVYVAEEDENELEDEDGKLIAGSSMTVEVKIDRDAHKNAEEYFTRRRALQGKLQKTIDSTGKALKGAEKKGARLAEAKAAKEKKQKPGAASTITLPEVNVEHLKSLGISTFDKIDSKMAEISHITQATVLPQIRRKHLICDKVNWFLTKTYRISIPGTTKSIGVNFLVISPIDQTQATHFLQVNGRFLHKADYFVHCDQMNSLPCILKHMTWKSVLCGTYETQIDENSLIPVPIEALQEASVMSIVRSEFWERASQGLEPSGWFCFGHQVVKSPHGYKVTGDKHILSPASTQVGIGFLFFTGNKLHQVMEEAGDDNLTFAKQYIPEADEDDLNNNTEGEDISLFQKIEKGKNTKLQTSTKNIKVQKKKKKKLKRSAKDVEIMEEVSSEDSDDEPDGACQNKSIRMQKIFQKKDLKLTTVEPSEAETQRDKNESNYVAKDFCPIPFNEEIDSVLSRLTSIQLVCSGADITNEIQFCLLVCAPFSTLESYKYKVELLPCTRDTKGKVAAELEQFVKDTIGRYYRGDTVITQDDNSTLWNHTVSRCEAVALLNVTRDEIVKQVISNSKLNPNIKLFRPNFVSP